MNIVFFTHPDFFTSLSMPRYARMLSENMKLKGHQVEIWSPGARLSAVELPESITKWLRYIDQYLFFPVNFKKRLKKCPADTLFVFTDVALGLWVPLVAHRPHVIHCHDFLAQRCAIGEVAESQLSWTGKKYQYLICKGYNRGKNFISVSQKTKQELGRFYDRTPLISEVVYNGLNRLFVPGDATAARINLSNKTGLNLTSGYLLHIGGNQWYKNRKGVVDIYDAWRLKNPDATQLVLIGQKPAADLVNRIEQSPFKKDIQVLTAVDDEIIHLAYMGASIFLFPSLAEGFGWPIVEAMASGCPVITTNEAPMTEVAGNAAFLIPARPYDAAEAGQWAAYAATVVNTVLNLTPAKKNDVINNGFANSRRFNIKESIDNIEKVYKKILQTT